MRLFRSQAVGRRPPRRKVCGGEVLSYFGAKRRDRNGKFSRQRDFAPCEVDALELLAHCIANGRLLLRREGVLVRTIEHLMASLNALAIDNVLIEIDADELPIFDGSATPWCEAIRAAGRSEQVQVRRPIRVLRTVSVTHGRRHIRIEPGTGLHVTGHIALAHFGAIDWSGAITPETFEREIAPSRSFGRYVRAMAGRAFGYVTGKDFLQGVSPRSAALLVRDRVLGGIHLRATRAPTGPARAAPPMAAATSRSARIASVPGGRSS